MLKSASSAMTSFPYNDKITDVSFCDKGDDFHVDLLTISVSGALNKTGHR